MHSDTLLAGGGPTLGRTLKGQYRIDSELGSGAMGVVYKGTQLALSKPVAIKMLRQDGFASVEARERFEREARMASMLNHPNVAQVFDFGIEDGIPYLVMEYVDGVELADVIRQGPLPPEVALEIARKLASVLKKAHQLGMVHRDIKPQNMKLVDYAPGGQIYLKVLDFGIARQLGEKGRLTATGTVLGTPMYMAPEQADGTTREIDGRADLYAAGIVLFEMLTGTVPFDAPSLAGVLMSQIMKPPPELPRGVPEPLRKVVERLLRKNPADRFASAEALDAALHACEESCRNVPALPAGSVGPVSIDRTSRTSTSGMAGMIGGALALAAIIVGGVLYLGPKAQPSQTSGGGTPPVRETPQPPPPPAPPLPVQTPTLPPRVEATPDPPDRHRHRTDRSDFEKDSPEDKESLDKAERLLEEGQGGRALIAASQVVRLHRSARGYLLMALCRCAAHDQEMARHALKDVAPADRAKVKERCRAAGVDL